MTRPFTTIMRTTFASFFCLLAILLLVGHASADTLELRTGQIVQGKFIGGSTKNIRFQVNGQEQIFPTQDVLNIGFSDNGDASDSNNGSQTDSAPMPPPAQAADPAPAPPPAHAPDAPPQPSQPQANSTPPPPPNGPYVTIPAGTSVFVRMIDGIDSSVNQVGDPFHASLENALVVGDRVLAPKGADAYGRLTQAKDAGKISGGAELTLELTGIRIGNTVVTLDSTDYDVTGKGRGTQSAQRIGGGAVLGTIIGAIAGGGKGAAIGGVVGAGAGTAVQVSTHGQSVRVPSETVLEFRLQSDVSAPLPGPSN